MDERAPNVDLLTWMFGNASVEEDELIFADAADVSQSLAKGQLRTLVRQLVAGFGRLLPASASVSAPPPPTPTTGAGTGTCTCDWHRRQLPALPATASTATSTHPGHNSNSVSNSNSNSNSNSSARTQIPAVAATTSPTPAAGLNSKSSSATHDVGCIPASTSTSPSPSPSPIPRPIPRPSTSTNTSTNRPSQQSSSSLSAPSRPHQHQHQHRHRAPLVVCVHSFNDILYPALFLGVIGAGGQWTGSNPAYTVGELIHHLQTSLSTHIVTSSEGLDIAVAAARECGIPPASIFVLDASRTTRLPPGVRWWTELLQHGESDWLTFDDETRAKTTTIALFSTSGTTGLPKMAERSHHSFVAESFALVDARPKSYKASRLISVPMFHAFASALGLVSALRDGCPTFIMRRFNRQNFLEALHRHQITETALVPPLLLDFLHYTPAEQQNLQSLHSVWCGGSPLDTVTQAKALQLFAPSARIVQVWGMTEAGWITTFRYPEADNTGSVGRLIPGYEARCVGEDGEDVSSEDISGEILVKGPMLMRGYLGDNQATRTTIDEHGWLHTGDIGFIRKGKVYIVDRKKELIKVRGWQIAPAELEGVLLMHPDIVDAAVIGVSKPGATTEIPRAYVVRSAGNTNLQKTDIKVFLLQHLARYKISDCEIRFRNDIPKSVSGKILRKILRAECAAEFAHEIKPAGDKPLMESTNAWTTNRQYSDDVVASPNDQLDMFVVTQFFGLVYLLWQWLGASRFWRLFTERFGIRTAPGKLNL